MKCYYGKKCGRCGSPKRYVIARNCVKCLADYTKQWRANNREQANWHQRNHYHRKRQIIQAYKDKPCADCGMKYPAYVMDFDHIRGNKKFNISEAMSSTQLSRLLQEIEKCEVVCANCHRLRTHERIYGKGLHKNTKRIRKSRQEIAK